MLPPRDPGGAAPAPARGVLVAALIVAAVSAVGIWLCWRVFVDTWAGQRVEWAALQGARYGQTQLWQVAERVLDVVSVGFIAVVLLAAVLIALVRRRWSLAVQVAVLMIGANVTTRLVKVVLLDRPDLGVAGTWGNTLPSGHTTAAASISAVLLLVVPARVRPWAAVLGAAYTAATGVSTLVGQWHRPSDVVAAVLVVVAWGALACALVARHPGRPAGGTPTAALALAQGGRRTVPGSRSTALVLGLVAAVTAVPALVTLRRSWATVPLETRGDLLVAYGGGVLGVVAASCAGFAVLLVLRDAATARTARVG